MQSLYVVATGQHVGKTTVSLGIMLVLAKRGLHIHFFKPIGQQTVDVDGLRIDKDAVLMQAVLSLDGALAEISPVTVPSGFVENYLFNRDPEPLKERILASYNRLCTDCDVIVVEGTGHAGVGSCLDLSNADVASLIGAKALLVVEGGIGSTLDQVALNYSLLKPRNVDILGVVANKVWPDKRDRIDKALRQGLANMGLRLLGTIPYDPILTYPQVGQIASALNAKVICGGPALDTHVENILVAAMEPQNVLPRIRPYSLMITPGDRIDNILLALNSGLLRTDRQDSVVGLLLTGGFTPHPSVLSLMESSKMPVLMSEEETYPVSAKVQRMVFKIQPDETRKIEHAQRLVEKYVNLDEVLDELKGG